MKSFVQALMFSGRSDPVKDLYENEISNIRELLFSLNKKSNIEVPQILGFSGFLTRLYNENGSYIDITASFYGVVNIYYKNSDNKFMSETYYDTSGICAYLYTIMNTALQNKVFNPTN